MTEYFREISVDQKQLRILQVYFMVSSDFLPILMIPGNYVYVKELESDVGGVIWDSALVCSFFIAKNKDVFSGRRVRYD